VKCQGYTLKEVCPACGVPTKKPHPAKFSMDDRYSSYRLRMRRMVRARQEEADVQ